MGTWLIKSEPGTYSIDNLCAEPGKTTYWEGVRNFQARNFLRQMRRGDQALFYHSSCAEPGVVGIVDVVKESYPDPTAFDAQSKYFDAKSTPDNPRWFMVDVRFVRKLDRTISLAELRNQFDLDGLRLLRRGNRLSVMPVDQAHWETILSLA